MRLVAVILLTILFLSSALYGAPVEGVVYSTIFPGWGQMETGRYARGTLFMGTELIALTGLVIANIQYDRDIEALKYSNQLFKNATYIGDLEYYSKQMKDKWEDADKIDSYRKVLAGAAIGIWTISLVDMIWGSDAEEVPISLEINKNEFLITKSFKF